MVECLQVQLETFDLVVFISGALDREVTYRQEETACSACKVELDHKLVHERDVGAIMERRVVCLHKQT